MNAKQKIKKEKLKTKTYYDRTSIIREDFKINEQVLVKDIKKKKIG